MRTCRDCGRPLHQIADKDLQGTWAVLWADAATDEWVCDITGDEHVPLPG